MLLREYSIRSRSNDDDRITSDANCKQATWAFEGGLNTVLDHHLQKFRHFDFLPFTATNRFKIKHTYVLYHVLATVSLNFVFFWPHHAASDTFRWCDTNIEQCCKRCHTLSRTALGVQAGWKASARALPANAAHPIMR